MVRPLPQDQSQLAEVIVAPHAGFPAGNLPPLRHVVPPVGTVIDGVQQESLVARRGRKIGFAEDRPRDRQAGAEIAAPFRGGIGSGNGTGAGNGSGGAVYRSGGGVTNPVPVYRPEAQYPEEARKAGCQDSVLLSLVVDETGKPANINVIVPLAMGLDEAAVEAVSQWRFIPGRKDGKAVPVLVKVQVTFRLL